jgi:hypothetical protein
MLRYRRIPLRRGFVQGSAYMCQAEFDRLFIVLVEYFGVHIFRAYLWRWTKYVGVIDRFNKFKCHAVVISYQASRSYCGWDCS